jgi:hypothetical protein
MKRLVGVFVVVLLMFGMIAPTFAASDPPRIPPKGIEGPDVRAKVPPKGIEGPDVREKIPPKGIEDPDVR